MGLFGFLQKKKPRRENGGLPEQYACFRDILAPGQMIPAPRADGVVSLVVRETDSGIAHIGRDPVIYTVPGTIKYGEARIVCLLLRISEDHRCTYETNFDLMRSECVDDLKALSKQDQLSIIVVGETTWTCVEALMPHLGAKIGAHTDIVLSDSETLYEDETNWLTQKLIAALFSVTIPIINEHLKNIFDSGELVPDSVIRKFRITAADGKSYSTKHYNLDAIISIGHRVNSVRATQFRQWVTPGSA